MQTHAKISNQMKEELIKSQNLLAEKIAKKDLLITTLVNNKIKVSPEDVLFVDQNQEGNIVFIERGNNKAGYKHILEHQKDFKNKGISSYQLPYILMEAIKKNEKVGTQCGNKKERGRSIFRSSFFAKQQPLDIAVSIGSNGFVVGANPTSSKK